MPIGKLRTKVNKLTSEDLLTHPVWEFASDEEGEEGQDETTVRPFAYDGTLDPSWGSFVIRAVFELADGSQRSGYLTPPPPRDSENGDLGLIQPCITAVDGQVNFWCGVRELSQDEIFATYKRLGHLSAGEVFPLRFCSDVNLTIGPVTGEIPGFLILDRRNFTDVRSVR